MSLGLLCLVAQTAAAQTPVDSLLRLDSAWARAYATHDTALAAQLFSDSLIVTSGEGRIKDKAGEIGDVRPASTLTMHYFRTSDVVARVYGSTAVVIGLAEWSFTYAGRVSTARRRYTAVYTRDAGSPLGWQMVALHIGAAAD